MIKALIFGVVAALLWSCQAPEKRTETIEIAPNKEEKIVIEKISLEKLVPEKKEMPNDVMKELHAQHHGWDVLERRTVPGPFVAPQMQNYSDYVRRIEDLEAINPGPGEYVHVMEGQRNGYLNLTVGITETFPGGAPPMHTHKGEEAHVLLEGTILYALGDTTFTIDAPYIVNIPPMMPHAFKNIDDETANLVVIFPTNVWEYDVLNYFPFEESGDGTVSRFDRFKEKLREEGNKEKIELAN